MPSFEGVREKDIIQETSNLMNSLNSNLDSINSLLVNYKVNKIDEIINLCQESHDMSQKFLIDNKNLTDINILDNIHTLKNNFGAIIGFCNYIKDGEAASNEEVETFVGYMIKAINKSYDLLIIDNHEFVNIHIEETVNNLINQFSVLSLDKNITIENKVENIEVRTDPKVLVTALENLISNAIKFSNNDGTIKIWSEKTSDKVKIYVKDEGVGIPADRLNNFFDQLGSTSVGTKGEIGTGVGMYTSKKLLNIIEGDIEVLSEEGKGSTFVIELPIK